MPRRDDYDYDDDRDDRREENYDDYQHDDYDDRPRGGRSRERAAEKASLPGIFMIVLGILGLLFAVARTIYDWTVGMEEMQRNPGPFGQQNKELLQVMMIVGPILNVAWALIVLFGGIQLRKLKSRGFVIFASIWAMLPCSLCCVLGLFFGIWTLIVALNEDVKRSFT